MRHEIYLIEGMHCAACSSSIERVTRKMNGVIRSDVNLTTNKMDIEYDEKKVTPEMIMAKVEKAGFQASPMTEKGKQRPRDQKDDEQSVFRHERNSIALALVLSAVLLYISMGVMLFNAPLPDIISMKTHTVNYAVTQMLLALIIVFIGRRFFISGFKAIFHLNPNMDSLVAIGSSAAFIYSFSILLLLTDHPELVHQLFFEASAIVVTLVSLGKYMETGSKRKTTGAIRKLIELTPDSAILIEADGTQHEVATETLSVGNTVLVKPGSKIPLDGIVTQGSSSVDESMLTGESVPIEKVVGTNVIGGSINKNGILYIKIIRVGTDTTLSKIIRFVEEAQGKKAPISKIADKVAGIFVPIVIVIAVVSSLIWLLIGKDSSFVLRVFTSVLVIACPCAMGLATPTAIVVGMGLGANNGILIRSGESLEITYKTTTVVLDKTGTVTEGKPAVVEILTDKMTFDELLSVTALVESVSQHPLASAIVEYARSKAITSELTISKFENYSGKGIRAELSNKQIVLVGNNRLMQENQIDTTIFSEKIKILLSKGETPMFIAIDDDLCGIISVADSIKSTSITAVKQLKEMGLRVVMLTGDNKTVAEHVGKQIGADEVIAEVLPEDKATAIKNLQKEGQVVLMVGDGINDAPALVQADVGCAIGNGNDVAIESADIILMKNDLRDVKKAVNLSRMTIKNIKQNLFWAFCYNIVGIPIAAGVLYPTFGILLSPIIGALAMSLSSVCVVSNALRLRSKKL